MIKFDLVARVTFMYNAGGPGAASYTHYLFFAFFPVHSLMRSMSVIRASQCGAAVAALSMMPFVSAGCSRTDKAEARGRDDAAKSVKTESVREEAIHRAVEVIGTLAAVDEVTISSEAEGRVSKLMSDLGDRVKAGQVLLELDNEKPQYTFDQQKAALDSTLAKYGASATTHL